SAVLEACPAVRDSRTERISLSVRRASPLHSAMLVSRSPEAMVWRMIGSADRSLEAAKLSQSCAGRPHATSRKRSGKMPLLDIHGLPAILIGTVTQSASQFARTTGI